MNTQQKTQNENKTHKIQRIRVDNTLIAANETEGNSSLELNGETVVKGLINPKEQLETVREALKQEEYEFEEFIQDREKTDSRPENGDRYALSRIYSNGDVENLKTSNNKKKLVNHLVEDLEVNA